MHQCTTFSVKSRASGFQLLNSVARRCQHAAYDTEVTNRRCQILALSIARLINAGRLVLNPKKIEEEEVEIHTPGTTTVVVVVVVVVAAVATTTTKIIMSILMIIFFYNF